MPEVVIVGGGVIGLSIAWELAGQGTDVCVLEKGDFGREASWAGAGMLPPGNPPMATTPESLLRSHSHQLWKPWSARLLTDTGIDNGYRLSGGLEIFPSTHQHPQAEIDCWKSQGVAVETLSQQEISQREPAVCPSSPGGYLLPEMGQIRNPRHLKALRSACAQLGVRLVSGCLVAGWEQQDEKILAAETVQGRFYADHFCIAGGAWSQQLLSSVNCETSIEPVRGQIVQLYTQSPPFRHIIQQGESYLVPRPDGRILVGSTMEYVGFQKQNTAEGIASLLDFACSLVPDLKQATFERSWSGLRPGSASGLPYLGQVNPWENLFLAAGHFRNGLQMSPITGVLMRQLIQGKPTEFSLDAFAVPTHQPQL